MTLKHILIPVVVALLLLPNLYAQRFEAKGFSGVLSGFRTRVRMADMPSSPLSKGYGTARPATGMSQRNVSKECSRSVNRGRVKLSLF